MINAMPRTVPQGAVLFLFRGLRADAHQSRNSSWYAAFFSNTPRHSPSSRAPAGAESFNLEINLLTPGAGSSRRRHRSDSTPHPTGIGLRILLGKKPLHCSGSMSFSGISNRLPQKIEGGTPGAIDPDSFCGSVSITTPINRSLRAWKNGFPEQDRPRAA